MRVLTALVGLLAMQMVAAATPTQGIVQECWKNHSHPQMSQCVVGRAVAARSNLVAAENSFRAALAKSSEKSERLREIASQFQASIRSFQTYRKHQCGLQSALASSGNGAPDIHGACEAELDAARAEQLTSALSWLQH